MAPQPASDESQSLEERIRMRAYQRYLDRGCHPGLDLDDWLEAEEEILALEEPPASLEP